MAPREHRQVWERLKGRVVERKELGEAYASLYNAGYLYPIGPFSGIYYVMGEEERVVGRPKGNLYSLLSQALDKKLGREWHYTGHTALFLQGLRHQPPSVVEVVNTRYSGLKDSRNTPPVLFHRIQSIAPYCGVVGPYRTATPERVNADFLYLYLKGRLPLSRVPSLNLPPCAEEISPLLPKLVEVLSPPPLPFGELYQRAPEGDERLYVDAILSLAVAPFQRAVEPFSPTSPLVLKGGTAIVKAYLGHYRFSYDLDFTYKGRMGRDCRKAWLEEAKVVALSLGFRMGEAYHSQGGRITTLPLYPPYTEVPIKLTVSCIDGELCNRSRRKALASLLGVEGEGYVMALPELLAEKVRALATRKALREGQGRVLYRDVVDVHFLLKAGVKLDRQCLRRKFMAVLARKGYSSSVEVFLSTPPTHLLPEPEPILNVEPPERGELISSLAWAQQEVAKVLDREG